MDADKDNYLNYHKRLIELIKVGGVIGYDNTLWNGSVVAPPDAPLRKYVRYYRDFVLELNKALAVDPRIEICMLPVGDGITLCRRIKWFIYLRPTTVAAAHRYWPLSNQFLSFFFFFPFFFSTFLPATQYFYLYFLKRNSVMKRWDLTVLHGGQFLPHNNHVQSMFRI